jgi:hypothetical protein
MGDPVGELTDRVCGELMAAGLTLGDGRRAGLVQQVVPRPVEQLPWDDVVAVALGHEDGQVGQLAGSGGEAGIEGQGPVEDGCPGVAGRIVEHQAAGEGSTSAP